MNFENPVVGYKLYKLCPFVENRDNTLSGHIKEQHVM